MSTCCCVCEALLNVVLLWVQQVQGCQSGAMALKTAPVKISWRQGLLLQRQTTLQQAIMNCLTALSGHAANARCTVCSTVAPQRRHMHHGHTYLQPNKRACAYGRRFLCMRSARNAAFSAPAKINFDTPDAARCGYLWSNSRSNSCVPAVKFHETRTGIRQRLIPTNPHLHHIICPQ